LRSTASWSVSRTSRSGREVDVSEETLEARVARLEAELTAMRCAEAVRRLSDEERVDIRQMGQMGYMSGYPRDPPAEMVPRRFAPDVFAHLWRSGWDRELWRWEAGAYGAVAPPKAYVSSVCSLNSNAASCGSGTTESDTLLSPAASG
jgi:hypothetical protein